MKKYILLILSVILIAQEAFANSRYIESQREEQREVNQQLQLRTCGQEDTALRITAFATNPPFSWVEKEWSGNKTTFVSKGFLIDFIKDIAKELNIAVEAVGYPTDSKMLADFQAGNIDMIVGMYYDPKLQLGGNMFLVPSVIQNVISVVFMKGKEKTVETFEDLAGLKGVVRRDEQFYNYIRLRLPKSLEIEEVIDSREAFLKLLTGEVDYILSSPYAAEAEARRFKMNLDISMIPVPLLGQELSVLYSGQSACKKYANEIAKKIKEKRNDMNGMKRNLITYINNWGQNFKNDPSLASQLQENKQEQLETVVQ